MRVNVTSETDGSFFRFLKLPSILQLLHGYYPRLGPLAKGNAYFVSQYFLALLVAAGHDFQPSLDRHQVRRQHNFFVYNS